MGEVLGGSEVVLGTLSALPEFRGGDLVEMSQLSVQSGLSFPATRDEALIALEDFVPRAEIYARRRNHLVEGHPHVSRLSPALRTRLLLETEVREAVEARFARTTVEKFVQEVWWRLYWKGHLEMRPNQWSDYRESLETIPDCDRERAIRIERGESGVEIMDYFARELIDTGYLHNHARMWFAGFWIHTERLPWELGADFFLRHLLDGDAASNTLSWRWVAGLQTPGKTYLARRSNIEKYVDPVILDRYKGGLERLEGGSPNPNYLTMPARVKATPLPDDLSSWRGEGKNWGWWLHDEDLAVDQGNLFSGVPIGLLAPVPSGLWEGQKLSEARKDFLKKAIGDGARRLSEKVGVECPMPESSDLSITIADWAEGLELRHVVAMRPFAGPLNDRVESIASELGNRGIDLVLLRRAGDREVMSQATSGFFRFWKSME